MQSDGLNSALSPVVYGDIALSINTQYNTTTNTSENREDFDFDLKAADQMSSGNLFHTVTSS